MEMKIKATSKNQTNNTLLPFNVSFGYGHNDYIIPPNGRENRVKRI